MIESLPEPIASALVLAAGLVVGSFLNVCIHRLPRGESVVRPGSRCPSCGASIRWYQNVPVISWIALRARCGSCGARISARYPFVEALAGVLALLLFRAYGATPAFAFSSAFALALVVLFFTDLDHKLLPDVVTLPGFVVGAAAAWANPFLEGDAWRRTVLSLAGAALGAGFLWAVGAIWERLRGVEAMGLGDVKMMAMVGAFTGPRGVLFTLFAASVAGAAVGVALIPLRGGSLKDTLPFGCFLAPAALPALLWARPAVEAYLRLLIPGV